MQIVKPQKKRHSRMRRMQSVSRPRTLRAAENRNFGVSGAPLVRKVAVGSLYSSGAGRLHVRGIADVMNSMAHW